MPRIDATLTETERRRGQEFAAALSIRTLTRAWQILSKGLAEVQAAPRPIVAAEMLLVRLAYAADLPTPDEALRMLRDGARAVPGSAAPAPRGGGGGATAAALARPVVASANPPATGAGRSGGGAGDADRQFPAARGAGAGRSATR